MIGERLKNIRKEKKLSQKAFADILGTSSGYISEIEQGKTIPGGNFLCSLNRVLNISIDWLLTGNGPPYIKEGDSSHVGALDEDPEVASLLEMTRQIVKSDTSYAFSLMANIKSFHQAMTTECKYQDLESRMARIEQDRQLSDRIRESDPSGQKEEIIKKRAM